MSINPSSTSTLLFYTARPASKINTLSLHDALPIFVKLEQKLEEAKSKRDLLLARHRRSVASNKSRLDLDRKSTRLNSSHRTISYAVFCLIKKSKLHGNYDRLRNVALNATRNVTNHI